MRRGQAAIELLLVLAFAGLLLLPFVWTALKTSQTDTTLVQARKLVNDLASAAEYVYAQGPGSIARVRGTVPAGVVWNESYIGKPAWAGAGASEREINLRVETSSGYNDVWKTTNARLRGSWPDGPGVYVFNVYMSDDGYVIITPYLSIVVDPHYQYLSVPAGNTSTFQYSVSNYLDGSVGITMNVTGEVGSWVTLSNATAVILSQGREYFNATVAVPYNASPRIHYATIVVSGANATEYLEVEVNVYNSTIVTGNYTRPVYTVQTYKDPGYTVPWDVFYQGKIVNITGSGWDPNSIVTLNVSVGGTPLTGFPKDVQTDSSGNVQYYLVTNNLVPGTYLVELNDSTDVRTTSFEVRECA